MAKRTIEKYYSDLSGTEIDSVDPTIQFAIGGFTYEIDLTAAEQQELTSVLEKYVSKARSIGKKPAKKFGTQASVVRAWAVSEGLSIPAKGRIPLEIQTAYEKAH